MKFASPMMYTGGIRKKKMECKNPIFNTNVVLVSFQTFKNIKEKVTMGDPFFCVGCKVVLNCYSPIYSKEEYETLCKQEKKEKPLEKDLEKSLKKVIEDEEEEEEEDDENNFKKSFKKKKILVKKIVLQPNEKVWVCEFCDEHNKLQLEQEEIPKENDVGKVDLKHGISPEEYEQLKAFLEPGAEKFQFLPHQDKGKTWVSRKQCVLAAIESQIEEFKKNSPFKRVGMITFNNDVLIIGDGCGESEVIAGDKLNKYEEIEVAIKNKAGKMMCEPVHKSADILIKKFAKLEEGGKTALGPAILSGIFLLETLPKGSMMIICTDGLANNGLGSLDVANLNDAEIFFQKMGELAQEKGIVISLITIKGEGCNIETVGKLATMTGGNITRVSPDKISDDFANVLKDELVGFDINMEFILHKGLAFNSINENDIINDGSKCIKKLKNATVKTEVALGYELKSEEELMELKIDIENQKEIPMQTQVSFTSIDGDKYVRVITKTQKLSKNKIKVERKASIHVLHKKACFDSADYAMNNMYENSKVSSENWVNYLKSDNFNDNIEKSSKNMELLTKQEKMKKIVEKKGKKISDNVMIKNKEIKSDPIVFESKKKKIDSPKLLKIEKDSESDDESEVIFQKFKKGDI